MAANSSDEDEQLARDMQLAFELQAKEERHAKRRVKKSENHMTALECGFSHGIPNADHMLFVKCVMDGMHEVELLVDTGASSSAMSTHMVEQLGLHHKLNTNIYGNAKGVGSSNIVGLVENVECMIGHVEFRLFFMVIEGYMPYCILGLDQMRRFKCQVDLDQDMLVFGGRDGVNIPFLSKAEAKFAISKMIGGSAPDPSTIPAQASLPAATHVPHTTPTTNNNNNSNSNDGVSGKLKSLFRKR